jgi:transposase
MELWTEIRRRVLTEEISKRQACREYDLHWQTLIKILEHPDPPGYRISQPRAKRKLDAYLPIIHQILKEDSQAPRKQRHTATRIWQRLQQEHGFEGSYTIVREAVQQYKQIRQEVFLPLKHDPGEAQVDFGEAKIVLQGQQVSVSLFAISLPYSGVFYIQAFPKENTEAFLEGHRRAFEFFGGVPKRISYDNLKIAVAQITGSRERKTTKEFLRLQSHYLFQEHFCLVRRPNEKGQVERLIGFARKQFFVPVPQVNSLEELNQQLEQQVLEFQEKRAVGKQQTKRELFEEERKQWLPLPTRSFEARRLTTVHADTQALICFETNRYSVPVEYAHRQITVIATIEEVRLIYENKLIARHRRSWEREQYFFEPVHYLALLERKPGGFDYAKPLKDWELPECFAILRRRLERSWPDTGTREFIRVLRLLEKHSLKELTKAVEYGLTIGALEVDAIRVLVEYQKEQPTQLFCLDGRPHLKQVAVQPTDVSVYQSLLQGSFS